MAAPPSRARPGRGQGRGGLGDWPCRPGTAPSQTSLPYQETAEQELGTEAEGSAGAQPWVPGLPSVLGLLAGGEATAHSSPAPGPWGAACTQPSEVVNCIKSLLRNKLLIHSLAFSRCFIH